MSRQEILRAFKFALDPTPAQTEALRRHAGAARWAFNYALGMKVTAHEEWRAQVAGPCARGLVPSSSRARPAPHVRPVRAGVGPVGGIALAKNPTCHAPL